MTTLQDVRRQHPGAYDDMSDDQLAHALHDKFYSDMAFDQFAQRVGLQRASPAREAARRGQSVPAGREAANVGLTAFGGIPFAHDLGNITAGVANALPQVPRLALEAGGITHGDHALDRLTQAYRVGADRQAATVNAAQQDLAERRPNAAALSRGVGAAAPIALALMADRPDMAARFAAPPATAAEAASAIAARTPAPGLASMAARGGARGFMGQTAQGAITGGAYGGLAALGSDGSLDERLNAGLPSIATGAALGAGAPTAVNAARFTGTVLSPAARFAVSAWDRLPTAEPNSVGALGGNMRLPPRRPAAVATPPPQRPPIPGAAINTVETLMRRQPEPMTAAQLETHMSDALANPQGQRLADPFAAAGRGYVRAAGKWPGRAGGIVEEAAAERAREAPNIIEGAIRGPRGLDVGTQSVAGAEADLAAANEALEPKFAELFRNPSTPAQLGLYQQRVVPLLRNSAELLRGPVRNARAIFSSETNGAAPESNIGRYLHILKNQIGLAADFDAANGGMRAGALRRVYGQLNRAIDPTIDPNVRGAAAEPIVPGYRGPENESQRIVLAGQALRTGAKWFDADANLVRQQRQGMTEDQLYHARVGLAQRIVRMTAGSDGRNINVANSLSNNNVRRAITEAFDNPTQAADFLDNVVRTQAELARNSAAWTGGSTSAENIAQHIDQVGNVLDMGEAVHRGGLAGGAAHLSRGAWNAVRGGAVARNYAESAETLMRRIDQPHNTPFFRELIRILREREAAGASTSVASQAAASQAALAARPPQDQR